MEFAPISIRLGDLIECHYSYLHRLKRWQTLLQGKSTARRNLQFLGTPHLYHDQAKCFLFSTSETSSFPEGATNRYAYVNYDEKMTKK